MNRLGNEPSLYLRQHAENPVHWHPWDDEALALARDQDRPILLSIGYSACHWCHVMAHESFEDVETAALMNRHFVNIKVDREERPDLDRSYQLAHQLLTGRGGGWPLTVFLDPESQVPFFAGTYFPLERRYGMPAFREVLQALHQFYQDKRDDIRSQNGQLVAAIDQVHRPETAGSADLDADGIGKILQQAAQELRNRHDRVNGGYGGAPKFPQAPLLEAVCALAGVDGLGDLEGGLDLTLRRMAASGLRDHLDGGFFRYCVDADWTIPHFEKMLYDNAMLLPLYAEASLRTGDPLMKRTAEGIAGWLVDTMKQPGGGYAASIDADAGGEEGGFHVWTPDQVAAVLDGEDRDLFSRAFGLDQEPNFENRAWHLLRREPDKSLAREFDRSEDAVVAGLEQSAARLREAREERVHPTLDDKRLTSWNALLAGGFVRAGTALDNEPWLDEAAQIFGFVRRELWDGKGLLAVFNAGEARFPAYLDDYAWLLDALLDFLGARWDRQWLEFATAVADALLGRFEDRDGGGFHFSDAAVEVPMGRSMIFQDDATPAGNARAITALQRLAHLVGEPRYAEAADRCLARALPAVRPAPLAHASLVSVLANASEPAPHIVIAGHDPDQTRRLKRWVDRRYRVDCYLVAPAEADLPGILGNYRSDEPVTAWLCRGPQCLPPVQTREELERLLEH
ncbi:MAG: thioredoxin domain-containing protein [Xanthomonadales bacterium]|nr:thioredoxin domain-containing protein [Xanthomonadales bacterium]